MKRTLKAILVFGFAVTLGLLFIAPAQSAVSEKVFILAGPSPIPTLDSAVSTLSESIMFSRNIFQGLVRFKFNSFNEIEGDLAKSWTVSTDGLVYTFKLRDNIYFHKGFGKVTAHDVKFSFDRILDPKTRSVNRSEIAMIKEVQAVDDYTVKVILKERDAVFLMKCARPRPINIVSRKAAEKFGLDFGRNPIGSGPFVFQSMTREQIIVTANKEYYEGPPALDKVIYKVVPDMDTLIMALLNGEVHSGQFIPRDRAVFERLKAAGIQVKNLDRGAWQSLHFNPRIKPLDDLRIRQAIAHAINRDEIIEHVLGGTAEKLNSPIPKGYFGHTEEGLKTFEYNPEKARKLMAEAGYPNGFEVTLDTFNSPGYLPGATAIVGQLAKVGIKCKLDVTDQPAWMKKFTGGTANMTLLVTPHIPDADVPLTNFFHSSGFSPGRNLARYDKLDKEINAARENLDPKKREKMYQEIQKKLMEDLPILPLYMMPYPTPYQPKVWAGLPDRDPVWGFDFYHFHFVDKK
jgi:peptide/nickel transport system substrate-binding protein